MSDASTPVKLRLLLIGLLALILAWGITAASTVAEHASAASNAVSISEPLSLDAQQIYRSLSDADATEAAAFLSGGLEPLSLRYRYEADIAQAARRLEAATAAAGSSTAGSSLATLAAGLPEYTGLVETARANNRQGFPVGAAYLAQASNLMRSTLLPAARDLYAQENAQLSAADNRATALPYLALVVAVLAGVALYRSQRWLTARTHRIVNPGLLLASLAGLASAIWLLSAVTVARANFDVARDQGSAPVEAMARADIAALQAHADESLTLISRGGDTSYQQDFLSLQRRLGPGTGTLLSTASTLAHGSPGGSQAAAAARGAPAWFSTHARVRLLDNGGRYTDAVHLAIGSGAGSSGVLFDRLDSHLTSAIHADQAQFRSAATAGQGDLAGLEAGVIVLAVIMAAGCALGISRRLAEYR
jgi:hypothetical protein